MKKIPTLFERTFENHKVVGITDKVTPGFEWVLEGEGIATIKLDGSCCAIIDGEFYKRYDAKKGKKPPEGAIPCCDPDPVTGHWPHWVKLDENNPSDKWFFEAFKMFTKGHSCSDFIEKNIFTGVTTFEAVGPHFQGNPYHLEQDTVFAHGVLTADGLNQRTIFLGAVPLITGKPRTFEEIRLYLENHEIEGIVFWKDGEPQCKIKRSDFGFEWPIPVKE